MANGMDTIVTTSRPIWRKWLPYGIGAALLVTVVSVLGISAGKNRLSVSIDKIRTAEVMQAPFIEAIPITGSVEPLQTVFLDAVEGGTVQEKYVEPGAMVEKGQPLLKLSNTNLMLDFMNRETQIVEQINNLRNTRIQMELNERTLNEQVIDIEYQLENITRQYHRDTTLYQQEVIARQVFEDSHAEYVYLQRKKELLLTGFEQDAAYRTLQLVRIDRSIDMMERNLDAIRTNLENLVVKAPISGQLTAFHADIGESKNRGENLGRIDKLDGYRITAQVDEHYISRVQPGQQGTFSLNGVEQKLVVLQVLPEVQNSQFEVKLAFVDSVPQAIRRGQTFQIQLALGQSQQALLVPRGGFYSSTGGKWIYVLTENGTAEKRTIELGRQNVTHYEVVTGLEPNEWVITSSYRTFDTADELIVTQE